MLLAGPGRAGEVDHVGVVDQRGAGLALAGRDLEDVARPADGLEALLDQEARERRDLARLEDHRVARDERRDAVTERVRQRVVPRPDDADDAERAVAHEHLLAEQHRRVRLDVLVLEVLRALLRPEAERVGDEHDLGDQRVLARLAGLVDDRLDHPLAVLDEPGAQVVHDLRAALEADRVPGRLSGARPRRQLGDLLGRHVGNVPDRLPGSRVLNGDRVTVRRPVRVGGSCLLHGGHALSPFSPESSTRESIGKTGCVANSGDGAGDGYGVGLAA